MRWSMFEPWSKLFTVLHLELPKAVLFILFEEYAQDSKTRTTCHETNLFLPVKKETLPPIIWSEISDLFNNKFLNEPHKNGSKTSNTFHKHETTNYFPMFAAGWRWPVRRLHGYVNAWVTWPRQGRPWSDEWKRWWILGRPRTTRWWTVTWDWMMSLMNEWWTMFVWCLERWVFSVGVCQLARISEEKSG